MFNRRKRQVFHIVILFLLAMFSILPGSAMDTVSQHAWPMQKLDPVLRLLVSDQKVYAAPHISFPIARPHRPDIINAIIKVSGNPMAIETAGVRMRSVIGNIVTADVPLPSLHELVCLSNVIYVQAARPVQPALLDVSVPDTKANQVWQSVPGYTGEGVIVGVIDSGIDWRHSDFRDDDGTSRILYIWDQMVQTPGQFPAGYEYGTEWTKAHIDSGRCQEMDASGHGTHVASIMAGNGRDRHEFTGMAPEASIVAVKNAFNDADIIDATNYIFRKAEKLSRPAVVNMSFGSHWGPHDGTEMLDQALDGLLDRSGRAIIAGAGNDGDNTLHVGTDSLRNPVSGKYPWTAIQPSVGVHVVVIQVWYEPARDLSVRLLLPENDKGDLSDLNIGWVREGQFRELLVPRGPLAGAEVVIEARLLAWEQVYENFDSVYIHIFDNGDPTIPIDEYIYGIEYDGPGVRLDAYVVWRGKFITELPESLSSPDRSFLLEGDGDKTIISPGSAVSAICVGSYVTKSEWIDSENKIRTEDANVGDISDFSSRGPLLNGVEKPDIAAPGERIVAAFSADSWGGTTQDGQHAAWCGTSMSAPHVAGAVALMYQQNPDLTASEVKEMLTSAAIDRGPVGWDETWGYGKLDVLAAMGIPSAPRGLKATAASNTSITVTWLPNEESDIAGYILDAGYWTLDTGLEDRRSSTDVGKATSYQLTDVSSNMSVSLSVSTYDTDGNESPKSHDITIIPNPAGPDVAPPGPPEDLIVVSLDAALDLTWSRGREHDLAGYKVYYGTSSGDYDNSITVGNVTEYRIKNLTNGDRVYIAVSSSDTSGNESDKSEEVSAVPQFSPRSELQYQSGWPVSVEHDLYSSPTLYDMDGDGRLEVSISARDGKVYLLRHDGGNMPGWPISTDSASVSSPAVADVDGDGRAEIVVGAGEMVYMWHDDGTSVNGWPVKTGDSILASPALGDIDGDGRMEVVIGSRDSKVYAYNSNGSSLGGWPVEMYGEVHGSAAVGDVDGDSRLEIVIGSGTGNVYVFKGDGTRADGWPIYVGPAVHSSPVVGDIDGDGNMEIIAADGDGRVHAWNHSGDPVRGWPVDLGDEIVSSPALGDIDGNQNTLEIVMGTRNGSVYALKSQGSIMDGWPVSVTDIMTSSPALGDIDGDGDAEIVAATSTEHFYTGLVYAFKSSGVGLGLKWPVDVEGNINYSSPALGDLDGDGDVELVVGSCRPTEDEGGQIHAWDLTGSWTGEGILWGGFRHDPRHTGVMLTQQKQPIQEEEPPQEDLQVPSKPSLLANYPNPFEEGTWIPYNLSKSNPVLLQIYNAAGQLVKTIDLGARPAGRYEMEGEAAYWDGCNENGEQVASGVYFYQIISGSFRATRKMVVK